MNAGDSCPIKAHLARTTTSHDGLQRLRYAQRSPLIIRITKMAGWCAMKLRIIRTQFGEASEGLEIYQACFIPHFIPLFFKEGTC